MSLLLDNPQTAINEVVTFLRHTFERQQKTRAVIAVSGGIDSAVALTLLVRAVKPENVTAVLLPYGQQDTADGLQIANFNQLPTTNILTIQIEPIVDAAARALGLNSSDKIRLGNVQARTRMICVYDLAKKLDALVCGTENKSEHYLGYFTRFGDAASDLEPISQWYKTQVRQVAAALNLPTHFITKAPSAGLWNGQTDEEQLGFTYEAADQVLEALIDRQVPAADIIVEGLTSEVIERITTYVTTQQFKLEVPYTI